VHVGSGGSKHVWMMLFLPSVFLPSVPSACHHPQDAQAVPEEVSQFYSACSEFYEFFDVCSDFSDEFYEVNSAP